MHLKSLELSGFKSFPKKSLFKFDSPICAIVGPNGSGKSNIAEAFRFVLGEQSMKSLRGKKGEDLIFGGSKTTARMNRASVKVFFDNSKRAMNIDFDEVVIERIVHRDGQNEYLINQTATRLKDIMELLASSHIGSSSQHIISQGESDRILNATASVRRTMIEDALGLRIYQYKKNEAIRKLEKTIENIKSIEGLRREITPHLKFLEKQVEKIEKSKSIRDQLKLHYKEFFKRESVYIVHGQKKIETDLSPLLQSMAALDRDLDQIRRKIDDSGQHSNDLKKLIKLEGEIGLLSFESSKLSRELGKIEGSLSTLEDAISRSLENEAENTVDRNLVLSMAENVTNLTEIAKGETDINRIKELITSISSAVKNFVEKITKGDKKAIGLGENLKFQKKTLEENKKEIDHKITLNQKTLSELQSQSALLKKSLESKKADSFESEKRIIDLMTARQDMGAKINDLKLKRDSLNSAALNFKKEKTEAVILCGKDILDIDDYQIESANGERLSVNDILREDRSIQEERRRKIERMKIRFEEYGAFSGDDIMKEYRETSERETFLKSELQDLDKSRQSLDQMIRELEEKLDNQFTEGVQKINKEFNNFFGLMFGGGNASVHVIKQERKKKEDTDSLLLDEADLSSLSDEVEEEEGGPAGVDITVNLPKKKIKDLVMLSGGERALTSIALLFAMSQVNPPPFIILDETDAALDEANSKKYGDMIENLSKHSQLILITHNRETMSRAGNLYGITMGLDGISKVLFISLEEAERIAK